VLAIAELTGKVMAMDRQPATTARSADASTGNVAGNSDVVAVAPAALAQLDAIRDQWLQPLVDQLKDQAEEIGRLKAERDAAAKAADALREENAFLRAVHDQRREATTGQGAAITSDRGVDASAGSDAPRAPQRAWWRRWFGGG
jgi:hypothetical protein